VHYSVNGVLDGSRQKVALSHTLLYYF